MRKSIGKNVRRARRARKLTQRELAALMGVTRLTIVRIETGRNMPRERTLERLAKVLRSDVTELVA